MFLPDSANAGIQDTAMTKAAPITFPVMRNVPLQDFPDNPGLQARAAFLENMNTTDDEALVQTRRRLRGVFLAPGDKKGRGRRSGPGTARAAPDNPQERH